MAPLTMRGCRTLLLVLLAGWTILLNAPASAQPTDTLVKYAEDVLAYAAVPTNKTAKRLGWKTRVITRSAWDGLLDWWRSRRSTDRS